MVEGGGERVRRKIDRREMDSESDEIGLKCVFGVIEEFELCNQN